MILWEETEMRVINIKWDTDGDEDLLKSLPTEIEIPVEALDGIEYMDDAEERISNFISAQTGFCHYGYEVIDDDGLLQFCEFAEGYVLTSEQYQTYNIGFNDDDETQFDVCNLGELLICWYEFCKENKFPINCYCYLEHVISDKYSELIDGVTSCCGYDFGIDMDKAKFCPICGKKLIREE